jgi:thiamine pyrophosphate-dependent acetolactate synthase large subunit-like protein
MELIGKSHNGSEAASTRHSPEEKTVTPLLRPAIEVALSGVASRVNRIVTTVPGGYDMAILVAVERAHLSLVVSGSELGAALIASGFAWETGRPSLVVTITSPGVYGTMQALHAAAVNRIPLVLLSGETSMPGSVQCGDGVDGPSVTRATSALCAWSADVTRPQSVPGAVSRAVRIAGALRRPVHLNIPVHVAGAGLPA